MGLLDLANPSSNSNPLQGNPWTRYRPATWGGRLLEDLRTGGKDPTYRKNLFYSLIIHVMIIIVIPWLLTMGFHIPNYLLPKGSGVPDPAGLSAAAKVEQVKVHYKKVKKPRRKLILNTHSAIIFQAPDMDDSKTLKEVEQDTEMTYKSDTSETLAMAMQANDIANDKTNGTGKAGETGGGIVKGGMGHHRGRLGGGGGTQGGWPEGSLNAKVRFIRLNHGGENWDDDQAPNEHSDLNILKEFNLATDFPVETSKMEGYRMADINRMDKGFKPPFLYMTGTANIPLSGGEIKMIREYINEGGMIFGDAGSPEFGQNFRAFANSLFPGESLIHIADDDPIFQAPFPLPNGPPPLWHHDGFQCMGVKHQGRWVVFYHPGDLKDAFRSPDNSGLDNPTHESAVHLIIDVMAYAFNHSLELSKQFRK